MAAPNSAQLRTTFEAIPESLGKDFVRKRADNALRNGLSMEAALEEAMKESIELFPEVLGGRAREAGPPVGLQ